MSPSEYKASKERVKDAILNKTAKEANAIFWEEVADMTDIEASGMMRLIGMDIAAL